MVVSLIALLAVAATAPAAGVVPVCPTTAPVTGAAPALPSARLRRLDTLPPANLVLTVLRREGGCEVPVIVRYGIGTTPATRRSTPGSLDGNP